MLRLRSLTLVLSVLSLMAGDVRGQVEAEFDADLRSALTEDSTEAVASLVTSNRLAVLPFMRAILDEGVRARLEGDRAQFDINVHYAESIG